MWLKDRSPRSHRSHKSSSITVEILPVASLGRWKIKAYLKRKGHNQLPSPSTITVILHRNSCIDVVEAGKHRPFQRFEMEQPYQLWQLDFKGYSSLEEGGYCHPLSILDDQSRSLVSHDRHEECNHRWVDPEKLQIVWDNLQRDL